MLAVLVALGLLAAADARTLTPKELASLASAGFLRDSAESGPERGAHRSSAFGSRALPLRATVDVEMVQFLDYRKTAFLSQGPTGPSGTAPSDCNNNGDYYPHPNSCDKYFICVNGLLVEQHCASELVWNQETKMCDWKFNVKCASDKPDDEHSGGVGSVQRADTGRSSHLAPWPVEVRPVEPSGPSHPDHKPIKPELNSDEFKVVCYFTNWAWYRQGVGKYLPKDIDAKLCTHIVYGFAVLDGEQLTIKSHDPWADIDNKFYEKVASYREKGVKVTVAIGGWNDSEGDKYSRLVNNPAAREHFVETILEFIEEYGFDGLDLDWEYPKCWQGNCNSGPESDKEGFAALVAELSAAFRPKGYLLSAAVSPSKKNIDAGYDVPALSEHLDWISVMTYDYHGQWEKKTGHVAPMFEHAGDAYANFNINFTINYWISQGADRKKLVLGMPMYGRSFSLADERDHGLNAPANGGGEAGEFTRAEGILSYYEICYRVKHSGWKVVEDNTGAMGPYAYLGNQWVSFDDAKMIRFKSEWAKSMGLGGGMIWALDMDDFTDRCDCEKYPLLRTINRVLRGYRSPDPRCTL